MQQTLSYLINYSIQSGDTLSKLAEKFNSSIDKIMKENNIVDPDKIKAGQNIKISGVVYGGGSFGGGGAKGEINN